MTFSRLFLLPICASTLLLGACSLTTNGRPPSYSDVPKIVEDKIVDLEDEGVVLGSVNCNNKNIYLFPPKPGPDGLVARLFSERYIGTWITFDQFHFTIENIARNHVPKTEFEQKVLKNCR